jgi:hypothetical protein
MMLDRLSRGLCALCAAFPLAASAASSEVPPLPDRKPAHEESAAPPGDRPAVPWTDEEIAKAKADCDKLLVGVPLEYEPLPPIKEGLCGAPAPILLKSIGSEPRVVIDPPATVTCPLAAALAGWLKDKVQPKAKALLGTEVVKLANASSYVCRNRYGGADTPLSEHALANALDVSDFVFASGRRLTVLDTWPGTASLPVAPDGAKAKTASAVTGSVAAAAQATTSTAPVVSARDGAVLLTRIGSNPFETPAPPAVAKSPAATAEAAVDSRLAKIKSNPFVAPAAAATPEATPPHAQPEPPSSPPGAPAAAETLAEREVLFMTTVHDEACGVFGTTLGPAANEAHKNHFHLDMKARRHAGLCD